VNFAILGPLEVKDRERELALGGPKQRAVLAMLLLNNNAVVSRDRLIEGLWADDPPRNPSATLDTYVSRLRKLLPGSRLSRRDGGYLLEIEPGELDLDRFDELVARGEFADALALWRGPPLADLAFEPFASSEIVRLEERRLSALEQQFDARLTDGDGPELVTELQGLVREHPFRERLLRELMLALYRAGRQTDALSIYQTARRQLADELGLEPGPELRELERKILLHDPSLAGPCATVPVAGRRKTRKRTAAFAGTLVLAAAAVAGFLATASSSPGGLRRIDSNEVGRIDPRTGKILSEVSVGTAPTRLAVAADGSLWVVNYLDETLTGIDPRTSRRIGSARDGALVDDLAAGVRALWAVSDRTGSVIAVDRNAGAPAGSVALCKGPCGIDGGTSNAGVAIGGSSIWMSDGLTRLFRVDPATARIRGHVDLPRGATALTFAQGFVWAGGAGGVTQVDPTTLNAVEWWPTAAVSRIAVGDGAVWAATGTTIVKIDTAQGIPVAIPLGNAIDGLAVGAGAVWAVSSSAGMLYRIDPEHDSVTRTIRTGGVPTDVAVAAGKVWVSVR
jgi:DNA-binding SARP family transcriptional activator/streptogramin lyase